MVKILQIEPRDFFLDPPRRAMLISRPLKSVQTLRYAIYQAI